MEITDFNNFLKKIKTKITESKISFIVCLIFIILSGIILRTKLLILNPSYWYDTCALGLNINKSFSELASPLDCIQIAPVFFMWISKIFYSVLYTGQDIAVKDFILRLFPYICGILTLFMFPVLINRMFNNKYITLISLFLLAVNKNAIYYSIEFKQYETEMLISIILMYIFYDINFSVSSQKKFWCYSFLIAILLWFSNSSIFIILPCIFILFINALRNRNFKKFCLFFMPFSFSLFLFYLCYFSPVYDEMYTHMKSFWSFSDPSFFIKDNFCEKYAQVTSTLIKTPVNIFIFTLINISIFIFFKNYKALGIIILPVLFVISAGFFNLYPFQTRVILFLLPSFIILYSQIPLIFKENKIFTAILALILVFLTYKNLQIPVENYIINNYSSRELLTEIQKENPQLKNVISTDNNFILRYYTGTNSISEEYPWIKFENSAIPLFFKTAKNGEYWIYSPFNVQKDYCHKLKEYLYSNKKIKVINIYNGKSGSCSIRVQKTG